MALPNNHHHLLLRHPLPLLYPALQGSLHFNLGSDRRGGGDSIDGCRLVSPTGDARGAAAGELDAAIARAHADVPVSVGW